MARLYSNENFPQAVVQALRDLGHDVLTTHEAEKSYQAVQDEGVLAFVTENFRAVLTINRQDLIQLLCLQPLLN